MEINAPGATLDNAIKILRTTPVGAFKKLSIPELALVLGALPDIPDLQNVRKQIAGQLQQQLTTSWITDGHLCEVFAALTALWHYDASLITGQTLTRAVQRLIDSEVAVGGPYRCKGKVGVIANAHIAIFARMAAQPLPNVDAFLAKAIADEHFTTNDLSSFDLLYLLSKACDHPGTTNYVAQHWQQPPWQTPRHQAIAMTILKKALPPGLTHAMTTPEKNLVTNALIIEALYNSTHSSPKAPTTSIRQQHTLAKQAKELFTVHTEPLRSSGLSVVDTICKADENFEISLLPQRFARALTSPPLLTEQQYTTLSLASLYGWIAYTIYDDFLDGESVPADLPVANIAMRASLACFDAALPGHDDFQRYVSHIFAGMDEANAWEVGNCRFALQQYKVTIGHLPKYGDGAMLAQRSFAHALAPMAVLAQQNTLHTASANYIKAGFRHYLIARQLSDDLHDWPQDITAGQSSYVVTAILRDLRTKPGTYSLDALLATMQTRFRLTTLPKICQSMLRHIAASRQAFTKSDLMRPANDIYTLLDALEIVASHALDSHAKSTTFYQKK